MAVYRSIATTETDPQAPVTAALMKALDANATAITEGASGAPRIVDAALDTGAATSAGTTWVGLRTAGITAGSIGAYALLADGNTVTGGTNIRAPGDTLAGSSLTYASASGANGTTLSGTWRCMGRSEYGSSVPFPSTTRVTLWLRLS